MAANARVLVTHKLRKQTPRTLARLALPQHSSVRRRLSDSLTAISTGHPFPQGPFPYFCPNYGWTHLFLSDRENHEVGFRPIRTPPDGAILSLGIMFVQRRTGNAVDVLEDGDELAVTIKQPPPAKCPAQKWITWHATMKVEKFRETIWNEKANWEKFDEYFKTKAGAQLLLGVAQTRGPVPFSAQDKSNAKPRPKAAFSRKIAATKSRPKRNAPRVFHKVCA